MSDSQTSPKPKTTLDEQIDRVLAYMAGVEVDTPEYKTAADQLDQLYKIKGHKKAGGKVSADAMIAAGASLLGIILILGYEHGHVVVSKATGFVAKPKI